MLIEKIKKLLELSEQRAALVKKTNALKGEVDSHKKSEKALLEQQSALQKSIRDGKKTVALLELEIQSSAEAEHNLKDKLVNLTRQREVDAIKKEILTLQSKREQTEEQLLSELEQVEKNEKKQKAEDPILQGRINLCHQRIKDLSEQVTTIEEELKPLVEKTSEETASLPPSIEAQYKRIAVRLDRPISPVVDSSCGVCYSFISSQQLGELKKKQIGECRYCGRILFMQTLSPEQRAIQESKKPSDSGS